MVILVLIVIATAIVLLFTIAYFANRSFRQAVEAPKYQLLNNKHFNNQS